MDRYSGTRENFIRLGVDYDNLTFDEVIEQINSIEEAFYDRENNFIYVDVLDYLEDETYFNHLQELGVPNLGELIEKLSVIKDENVRSTLYVKGVVKILEAHYNAKDKILDKLIFDNDSNENNKNNDIKTIENSTEENPEPLVFKSFKAFLVFEKYFERFPVSPQNLTNYSFLFHKMKLDKLIHEEAKQIAYFNFLSKYDIFIERIKPLSQIGNKNIKEEIYNNCKE
uniref:hypothetical protein n=1 Tax=Flavobacterium sp. TaxID=239 RepID=UPI00404BA05B